LNDTKRGVLGISVRIAKADKAKHKVQQKRSARELLQFYLTATDPIIVAATNLNLLKELTMTSNLSSSGDKEPNTPAEEYKVGPGRPPKEHRWPPGRSGNPKGRKPKPPSLLPDLIRIYEEALSEKVTLKQGDKQLTLSMAEAGMKHLAAQFAKGDRHARRDIFACAEKLGIDLIAGHRKAIEEAVASDNQTVRLPDEFMERLSPPTVDELITVLEQLKAEKKNAKILH
jgi:hypothetical protein